MNNFQKEFIMDMFLDSDHACTMNRLIVATANVISENNDNLNMFSTAVEKEFDLTSLTEENQSPGAVPVTRRMKGFYENSVRNFTDADYTAWFKIKKSTVQVVIYIIKLHILHLNICFVNCIVYILVCYQSFSLVHMKCVLF